jgi:thiamine-monophosphate kinase
MRIENDAAELADGRVVTQDVLVEGVHFRPDWISWRDLGFRAAAVNMSDLAASGAYPEGLVVTLAAPSDTAVADVVELYEGLAEAGTPVIGGDTSSADRLVRPPLRLEEGRALARTAHALIDVSDGLARDAGHVAARSGCRLAVDLDRVPLAEGAELDDLGFGEDYELLAAVPDAAELGFAEIGRCEEGDGVELRLRGERVVLGGFEHFAGGGGTGAS